MQSRLSLVFRAGVLIGLCIHLGCCVKARPDGSDAGTGIDEGTCSAIDRSACAEQADCQTPLTCERVGDGGGCCVGDRCELSRLCEMPRGCDPSGAKRVDICDDLSQCLVHDDDHQCIPFGDLASLVARCEIAPSLAVAQAGALWEPTVRFLNAAEVLLPSTPAGLQAVISSPLLDGDRRAMPCPEACSGLVNARIGNVECDGLLVVIGEGGTHVVVRSSNGGPVADATVTTISGGIMETALTSQEGVATLGDPFEAVLVTAPGMRSEVRGFAGMELVVIDLAPLIDEPTVVDVADPVVESSRLILVGATVPWLFSISMPTLLGAPTMWRSLVPGEIPDRAAFDHLLSMSDFWEPTNHIAIGGKAQWAVAMEGVPHSADIIDGTALSLAEAVMGNFSHHGFNVKPDQPLIVVGTPLSIDPVSVQIPPLPCADEDHCASHAMASLWARSDTFGYAAVGFSIADAPAPSAIDVSHTVLHDGLENSKTFRVLLAYSADLRFESAIVDDGLSEFPDIILESTGLGCTTCDVIVSRTDNMMVLSVPSEAQAVRQLLDDSSIDFQPTDIAGIVLAPGSTGDVFLSDSPPPVTGWSRLHPGGW